MQLMTNSIDPDTPLGVQSGQFCGRFTQITVFDNQSQLGFSAFNAPMHQSIMPIIFTLCAQPLQDLIGNLFDDLKDQWHSTVGLLQAPTITTLDKDLTRPPTS